VKTDGMSRTVKKKAAVVLVVVKITCRRCGGAGGAVAFDHLPLPGGGFGWATRPSEMAPSSRSGAGQRKRTLSDGSEI
jgi:hypothetical protein